MYKLIIRYLLMPVVTIYTILEVVFVYSILTIAIICYDLKFSKERYRNYWTETHTSRWYEILAEIDPNYGHKDMSIKDTIIRRLRYFI